MSKSKNDMPGTPIAEVQIDELLAYNLLQKQHPDLAHLPIEPVDSGWDNVIFRLGDRWCLRLPRRQVAATLIENEQTWLPQLARRLPIPIPTPDRIGKPGSGYPWQWSVLPWLSGVSADRLEPQPTQVECFVSFLRSLHVPAPENAPPNPVRGVPLHQRAVLVEERMQRLKQKTDAIVPKIEQIWNRALNTPIDIPATWLHGDLHPRNILVENGKISGVIDWGDITSGDPATDLASIWMLWGDRTHRQQAITRYGASPATVQRARGWAILFGVVLLETGLVDNPQHALIGQRTLHRLAEDG
ncbi:MAG: aminoglycoside phosphotransferase family protein [Cyanobacteriota bacterium]|nr:aminoglycoside phosphotransferase family protein [Cyanobacteriota bacterium]